MVPKPEPADNGILRLLASLGLVAGLGFLFAKIGGEVIEGETRSIDAAILLAFRAAGHPDQPIGPHWLPGVVMNISSLGSGPVLGLLVTIAVGYLVIKRDRTKALLLVVAAASGGVVVAMLKNLFGRPRPNLVDHLVRVQTMSFPSGHAANSALVFLTIGALISDVEISRGARIYIMAVAMTLAILIGLSRLYLGIHWPTDVAAGWALGAGWATLWRVISTQIRKR